jgi:hypothetical protein
MQATLFSKTLQHSVLSPYIEFVDPLWLLELSNPLVDQHTDLGNWAQADLVSLEILFQDMLAKGMRDPFLLSAGRVNRHIRLEAGNHRVQLMAQHNIDLVPVVVYVNDQSIVHTGNGVHEGKFFEMTLPFQEDIMGPYPIREYAKLSDILINPPSSLISVENWKKLNCL